MAKTIEISRELARRVVLQAQLLDGCAKIKKGKDGINQIINRLGYVQIDTLTVINRAHHHTLWSRHPDYTENMLLELQAKDRHIFEYWGHALSYLPISDYRYFMPRMHNFEHPKSGWALELIKRGGHLVPQVIQIISKEGPKSSTDLTITLAQAYGKKFSLEAIKAALDLLFWKGDLMVSERRNFKKIYDLTERVLPDGVNTDPPGEEELGKFLVLRALSAFGIAREREIGLFLQPESSRESHFQAVNKQVISETIKKLLRSGEVVAVKIKEDKSSEYYTLASTLDIATEAKELKRTLFLLSPFDNLIIQRGWIKHLFRFDYTLECYVPASKRKYGYFVLPILWGDQFIGRLDPKADRKSKTFIIKNLFFEPQFTSFGRLIPLLSKKITALAVFNACDSIVVEHVSPTKIKSNLKRLLNR